MNAPHAAQNASTGARVLLRRDLFDELTESRGARTDSARAEMFGVARSTIVRLRFGHIEAGLGLAARMARTLGVDIEKLFDVGDKAA